MHVDNARKIYVTQIDANFLKVRFTLIKLLEIFENSVRLILFYANLLQYERLNIHL